MGESLSDVLDLGALIFDGVAVEEERKLGGWQTRRGRGTVVSRKTK